MGTGRFVRGGRWADRQLDVRLMKPGNRGFLARYAILLAGFWLGLAVAAQPLRAGPPDRQVAEWVTLMGGSVRLDGRDGRIRELADLPADDFQLEQVDLVGTNINPSD